MTNGVCSGVAVLFKVVNLKVDLAVGLDIDSACIQRRFECGFGIDLTVALAVDVAADLAVHSAWTEHRSGSGSVHRYGGG